MPSRSSRRTTATPSRTPPSRPSCPASGPGASSSSARRRMRAFARRSTAHSSGGTTSPWSATPTRRRTRRHGEHRRRTRSSRTRTCTGPTRRRRGGLPGRSRPRMSTSAALPEACAPKAGTPRSAATPTGTGPRTRRTSPSAREVVKPDRRPGRHPRSVGSAVVPTAGRRSGQPASCSGVEVVRLSALLRAWRARS